MNRNRHRSIFITCPACAGAGCVECQNGAAGDGVREIVLQERFPGVVVLSYPDPERPMREARVEDRGSGEAVSVLASLEGLGWFPAYEREQAEAWMRDEWEDWG